MCGRYTLTTPRDKFLAQLKYERARAILEDLFFPLQRRAFAGRGGGADRDRWGAGAGGAALGLSPELIEGAEDRLQHDQRAGGDRGGETGLPLRVPAPPLPDPGRRLLRMADPARLKAQAALVGGP